MKAIEFMNKMIAAGHKPSTRGNWLVWTPPIKFEDMQDNTKHADEICKILEAQDDNTGR